MRAGVKLQQFRLGEKSAEMNLVDDPEFLGQFFQVRLERTFAGDDQLGVRKFLLENREGAKRSGHPFLRDEPASLHESPAAILRRLAANKGKFIQRDAGPIDPQAFRRTPQGQQPIRQRVGTRQDERDGVEQVAQFRTVIADVFFLRDIGAVKRNDTRLVPALDEGQEMHAGMPEIDMHQVRAAPLQQIRKHLVFAAINNRRAAASPTSASHAAADCSAVSE